MNQPKDPYADGSAEGIYFARPKAPPEKAVLVLHAWWGLTSFLQRFCDRLAESGFAALAPDLYHGATAATIQEAKELRSRLVRATVQHEISEAAAQLLSCCSGGGGKIGAVGFSLGGYWALWLAEAFKPVAASVVFYGARPGAYGESRSAFQFHLAESDDYVAASGTIKLQESLRVAGREAEFHTYPGTTHWFFEADRADAYHAQAAELAWDRTTRFLQRHL